MPYPTYMPYGSSYGGYYQQPQQQITPMQTQQQISNGGLIWVEGAEAAKAYMVAPNNTVVLFDTKEPVMYIKSADMSGMPSTRTFQIEEIGEKPVMVAASVGKNEMLELKERITALENRFKDYGNGESASLKGAAENEPTV